MVKKKNKKVSKKKSSGILKILEAVVLLGAVAGVIMRVFQGKSKNKK